MDGWRAVRFSAPAAAGAVMAALLSGVAAGQAAEIKPTLEQFNQCIDYRNSLDQIIKSCTAVINWMTADPASAAGNDSTGEKYRVGGSAFYRYRGSAYYQRHQYDPAIADFTDAIHLNPMDSDAYYDRGEAYEDRRDYRQAIADFTKAFVAGKTSAASSIGHIYTKEQNYRLALQWFREGAAKGETSSMAMIALYYAARVVPDCESAREWIKKAISASSNDFEKKEYAEKLRLGFDGRCHF